MVVLEDKQYKHFNHLSRYQNVPYYFHKIDRKFVVGTTYSLNKDTQYTLYKVQKNDTLDSLALKFYNNPTYFWIIADVNNILDPYRKLDVGSQLKIPALNEIQFNIGK